MWVLKTWMRQANAQPQTAGLDLESLLTQDVMTTSSCAPAPPPTADRVASGTVAGPHTQAFPLLGHPSATMAGAPGPPGTRIPGRGEDDLCDS